MRGPRIRVNSCVERPWQTRQLQETRVRYLQDHILAYQDYAWGDGEILRNYRCTPGTPVDLYRLGHITYILISRREVKNRRHLIGCLSSIECFCHDGQSITA